MHFRPNKSSFHYRLLLWSYGHKDDMPKNFCSYWRALFLHLVFGVCLGYTVISPALILLMGFPGDDELGLMLFAFVAFLSALLFFCAVAISIALTSLTEYYKARKLEKKPKQDGLIKTKYKAWKHKYCPRVDYD